MYCPCCGAKVPLGMPTNGSAKSCLTCGARLELVETPALPWNMIERGVQKYDYELRFRR